MSTSRALASIRVARRALHGAQQARTVATGVHSVDTAKAVGAQAPHVPAPSLPKEHRFQSTMTVANLIRDRPAVVHSISKDATVLAAVKIMVKNNIGSLVVVSGENKVESVVSERDYLEKVIVRGRTSANTQVKDIMSEKSLVTVRPESTLTECMELMTANKVRHIPVVASDGTPIGLVSIGDTVKALVNSYKRDAEHMENFIAGNTY